VQVVRVVLAPIRWARRDVVRVKDLRYGNAPRRANLLGLYRNRTGPAGGPVLVYFHGGGYFSGAKSREARVLLEGLARPPSTIIHGSAAVASAIEVFATSAVSGAHGSRWCAP
jgi:acetyl esterase/lipase